MGIGGGDKWSLGVKGTENSREKNVWKVGGVGVSRLTVILEAVTCGTPPGKADVS